MELCKNYFYTFPGVSADGSVAVLDGFTLEAVTRFSPISTETGKGIHKAIFCSGLGSFCMCTEDGKLHFLHLVKKNELTEELASASASQASGGEKLVNGKSTGAEIKPFAMDDNIMDDKTLCNKF